MENKELILGIDDAGRGPLIGPMILAGCLIEKDKEYILKEKGAIDSKLLTKKKRSKILELIKEEVIDFHFESTGPAEIDTGMGIGLNLNQVEALKTSLIIKNLVEKLDKEQQKKVKIVIDCPSINTESWKGQLMDFLEKEGFKDLKEQILCVHKADLKFPIVSAASIVAKVTRDEMIEDLKQEVGIDFGSGYPADPKTKEFLKKYIDDSEIKKFRLFRESWSTYQNVKEGKGQAKLPDY